MEAKLESVLASISNPGLIAGSGGLVTDANARMPYSTLDSGPGGAEGRGDVHVGVDPGVVASALESIRAGRASGTPSSASASGPTSSSRPPLTSHRSGDSNPESAITRRDPIVLPSLAHAEGIRFEGGGAIGAHSEIGPSRTGGHPPHTMPMPPLPHAPHPAHQHHHVHFAGPGSGGSGSGPGNVPSAPASSNGGNGPAGLHTRVTSAPGSSTSKSSPMEWSGIKDPNAVDGSPRLHSLPDNTLNPYVGFCFSLSLSPPALGPSPCIDAFAN